MKRFFLISVNLLLVLSQSYAQFKGITRGMAFESKAVISTIGYAKAGGGVILKGKSEPYYSDKEIQFKGASVRNDGNGITTIVFETNKCNVHLTKPSWLLKDAFEVVNLEGVFDFTTTRDVNLLGEPTPREDTVRYPTDKYWYVEINKALRGSKTGEYLMLMDLLQTDVEFYASASEYSLEFYRYLSTMDSIQNKVLQKEWAIYERMDSLNQFDHILSDATKSRLSLIDFFTEQYFYDIISTKEYQLRIAQIYSPTNWTYNDEYTTYRHLCLCSTNKLFISGKPIFTFLNMEEDYSELTDYYKKNQDIIYSLNPKLFEVAESYAQVTAFLRYLKYHNRALWFQLSKTFAQYESNGNTPRIIER